MSGSRPGSSIGSSTSRWRPTTVWSDSTWVTSPSMAASSRPPVAARPRTGPRSTAGNRAANAACWSRRPGSAIGCVVAGAHRNDSPLLRPALDMLARFDQGIGIGMGIGQPDHITVHLDAGYDSGKTRDLLAAGWLPGRD